METYENALPMRSQGEGASGTVGNDRDAVQERCSATSGDVSRAASVVEEMSEAAVSVTSEAEVKAVMHALSHTPGLTECPIAPDVLAKLLPDDEVVELPKLTHVNGGLLYCFAKRAFDIVSCSAALVLLAIPMGAIALMIKRQDPGPAIYAQTRVGKDGKLFKVYKFRSMYVNAEARGAQWAAGDDPRVTPLGRKLRKTRLAPVIIGAPGDGEPTKSLSHPENSSLDLQKCERRPGTSLGARHHYTSFQFLSFAVFGGSEDTSGRHLCAFARAPFAAVGTVA